MLVTGIFSFSRNVFKPFETKFQFFSHIYCVVCECFEFGLVQNLSSGKELTLYHEMTTFDPPPREQKPFLKNIVEKAENL